MPSETKFRQEWGALSTTPYENKRMYPTTTQTVLAEQVRGSKVWVRTQNFVARKKTKSLPVNGFTHWSSVRKSPKGSLTSFSDYYPETTWTVQTGYLNSYGAEAREWSPSQAMIDSLDRKLLAKLHSKIKSQKINFAQAIAESRQTLGLISSTILRFTSAIRSIRHGDLRSAAKLIGAKASRRKLARYQEDYAKTILGVDVSRYRKDPRRFKPLEEAPISDFIGKWWLELQYGWKPLLSDIYGLAEHTAQKIHSPPLLKVSNKGSSPHVDRFTYSDSDFIRTLSVDGNVTINYGAEFSAASDFFRNVSQLGFTNPLQLAWEVLPYSFVIDWFLPVGNYLSNLDSTIGLTFVRGYKSIKVDYTMTYQMTGKATGGYGKQGSTVSTMRYRSFVRTSMGNSFPGVTFPDFKNPLGVEHVLNALALLKGAFRK